MCHGVQFISYYGLWEKPARGAPLPQSFLTLWPLVLPVRLELAVLPSAWAGQQLGGSASTQQLIQLGASRPGPFPAGRDTG